MEFLAEMTAVDWLGVLGSFLIASAYFLVSSKTLEGDSVTFQLMNLVGALLILWSLYYRPNAGAIMIEVLWIGIAVYSLAKIFLGRSKR